LSLFYFFGGDGTDRAGLGGGYIPRRWRPQPQRTRNDGTQQEAGQTVPKPGRANTRADHARRGTHARTLDTLHRSALDTRPPTPGRSRLCRALDGVERVRN
jgi:hypothetical protein